MSDDRKTTEPFDHLIERTAPEKVSFQSFVVAAERSAIQTLVLKVASLERAGAFLTEKEMLGSISEDQIRIALEKICGLDVRLVSREL
jgi:hypothetical protein